VLSRQVSLACALAAVVGIGVGWPTFARAVEPPRPPQTTPKPPVDAHGQDYETARDHALLLLKQGKNDEAIIALEHVRKTFRSDPDVDFALARAYAYTGRYLQAMSLLFSLRQAFPERSDMGVFLARVLAWDKRYKDAEQILKPYISDPQVGSEARKLHADVLLWDKRWPEAHKAAEEVFGEDPDSAEAVERLATVMVGEGRRRDAVRLIKRIPRSRWTDRMAEMAVETQSVESTDVVDVRGSYALNNVGSSDSRGPWQSVIAAWSHRFGDAWVPVVGLEWRRRENIGTVPGTPRSPQDVYLFGQSYVRGDRFTLFAEVGGTPAAAFSPDWLVVVEPGIALGSGLSAFVAYRHIVYESLFVDIPGLGILYEMGRLRASIAYWLSVATTTPAQPAAHIVFARTGYQLAPTWLLLGWAWYGTGGVRPELPTPTYGRNFGVLAGVEKVLRETFTIVGLYAFSRDSGDGDTFSPLSQHQFTLGLKTRL